MWTFKGKMKPLLDQNPQLRGFMSSKEHTDCLLKALGKQDKNGPYSHELLPLDQDQYCIEERSASSVRACPGNLKLLVYKSLPILDEEGAMQIAEIHMSNVQPSTAMTQLEFKEQNMKLLQNLLYQNQKLLHQNISLRKSLEDAGKDAKTAADGLVVATDAKLALEEDLLVP